MKMKKRNKGRRRFMTLIEIMIVMFLITIIAGVVSYKVKDSMDYGKAFKTHQGSSQVKRILEMKISKNPSKERAIIEKWKTVVERSPLAGNPAALIKDGWGEEYEVSIKTGLNGKKDVEVKSEAYEEYLNSHDVLFEEGEEE